MAKPTVRYPASINLRITADTKDKIARIADRRRVDEATVAMEMTESGLKLPSPAVLRQAGLL